MKMNQSFFTIGMLFGLAILLFLPPPLSAKDKTYLDRTLSWNISDSRVVDYGETSVTDEDTLTRRYIVEAKASSKDAPVKDGLFRATVTAFSSKNPKGRQRADVWYLKAKWEIISKEATKDKLKIKHNEYLMKGYLTGELDFNPAFEPGMVNARADFPLTLVGKNWGSGSGGFHGNELFEGNLNLTIDRWQETQ